MVIGCFHGFQKPFLASPKGKIAQPFRRRSMNGRDLDDFPKIILQFFACQNCEISFSRGSEGFVSNDASFVGPSFKDAFRANRSRRASRVMPRILKIRNGLRYERFRDLYPVTLAQCPYLHQDFVRNRPGTLRCGGNLTRLNFKRGHLALPGVSASASEFRGSNRKSAMGRSM